MEETIGSAVFELKLVTTDAENKANQFIKGLTPSLSEASNEAKRLSSNIGDFIIATRQLKDSINTFDGLRGAVSATVEAYNRYEASMNGMKAVAEATGNSISQSMTVIKESTANGLVNQSDAAAAIKNLELYGLSAQQAGELIATLTDAAVYNRQANYSVSEAVRVATEGIRMENSVLSDAAGVQTNIAKMQENYARELGISTDKLTQAQKAQAIYNGFMQEGSTYSGNAAKYTNSLAGSQAKLSSQIEITKSNVGRLFEIFGPLINGLADWLQHNQALATGLVTLGGILAAGGSLVVAVSAATQAISRMRDAMASSSAISSLLTGNIGKFVLTLGAVGAGAAVISTLNSETGAAAKSEERFSVAALLAKKSSDKQKDSLDDTAKSIQKVQDNLDKLTRDYYRDLKQIAIDHEENLNNLTTQIEEANTEYRRAIDERNASFNTNLAEQERSHQETVDELMTQLNFLQRYNNDYNRQKLSQVQFALEKEKALYAQETAARQAEIDLQNQADKEKLDARLSSLQAELDEEVAFMNKHREDLRSVRNIILLDEIESLKERYEEQKKSYQQQIDEVKRTSEETQKVWEEQLVKTVNRYIDDGVNLMRKGGEESGQSWIDGVKDILNKPVSFFDSIGKRFYNLFNGNGFDDADYNFSNGKWVRSGYASGGYTGRGAQNEIAGVVHRGEYVVPANMVDQSTGQPKELTTAQNITINISGTFATSKSEQRKVAEQIVAALNQVNQARLA